MSGTVLAIGRYDDWDREGMADLGTVQSVGHPDELAALGEGDRGSVRALAYKSGAPFGAAQMELLPNLGLIANYGVGYDAIDVGAATARGIRVTNTPDVLNDDVADLAAIMLIGQARQLVAGSHHVRSGAWARGPLPLNRTSAGRRVGILGLGRIGREIADRLAAFKMEIHYWSRSAKETPGWVAHPTPEALAAAVDDLVIAVVGGRATERMVGQEMLAALGPDGILVNISRGSVMDEEALIAALQSGAIRGAALDVFASEPDLDPRFLELTNVLLQPHQGSGTVETRRAMGQLQRDNIAAYLAGEALKSPVN